MASRTAPAAAPARPGRARAAVIERLARAARRHPPPAPPPAARRATPCAPRPRAGPAPAARPARRRWRAAAPRSRPTKPTGGGSKPTARGPSAPCQASVSPPFSAAATLSGWPSSSVASPADRAPRSRPDRPRRQPGGDGGGARPQAARERHRVGIVDVSPTGSPPAAGNAARTGCPGRWTPRRRPRPEAITSTPAAPRSTTTSLRSSSASARQSNPGPRLADEAGAVTVRRSGTDRLGQGQGPPAPRRRAGSARSRRPPAPPCRDP